LGRESGIEELSRLFYNRVFDDNENDWFVSIFASSTKEEAIDNQWRFFVQTFGGPDLYRQKGKGRFTRLSGRHANYPIGHRAADRWVMHMEDAMAEHSKLNFTSSSKGCDNISISDRSEGGGDNVGTKDTTSTEEDDLERMMVETKEAMRAYFKYTAHYIVVASEYMRDDQLSGGTRIDEGRVW
jgi:truncated hemoglobin YjbI